MKIKAIQNIYFLPRISEGIYCQEDIDDFLSSKISEGDILISSNGNEFYYENDTEKEIPFLIDQEIGDHLFMTILENNSIKHQAIAKLSDDPFLNIFQENADYGFINEEKDLGIRKKQIRALHFFIRQMELKTGESEYSEDEIEELEKAILSGELDSIIYGN